MNNEQSFLQTMQEHPEDAFLRLVFADWLEERGDPRAELLRLLTTLTETVDVPDRSKLEDRLRDLLASGVEPVGPFITNSMGMKFGWIPSGTFLMGSPANEKVRQDNETQHKVTLTRGFFMGIHLVTQKDWQSVMGSNPSHFKSKKNLPMETVSWDDCLEFIVKLQEKDRKPYRLPTEAEWEYACRAGTTTPFYFGETISTDQANYDGNYTYGNGKKGKYREKTTPIGSFPANAWGLHDMHGNVWEWCQDWYGDYPIKDIVDPQDIKSGEYRVLRGGSWGNFPAGCRSAFRYRNDPGYRDDYFGLRLCFCLD